jgi:hypothetical protein
VLGLVVILVRAVAVIRRDDTLGVVSGEKLYVASEAMFAKRSEGMLAQLEFQKLSGKSRIAG